MVFSLACPKIQVLRKGKINDFSFRVKPETPSSKFTASICISALYYTLLIFYWHFIFPFAMVKVHSSCLVLLGMSTVAVSFYCSTKMDICTNWSLKKGQQSLAKVWKIVLMAGTWTWWNVTLAGVKRQKKLKNLESTRESSGKWEHLSPFANKK